MKIHVSRLVLTLGVLSAVLTGCGGGGGGSSAASGSEVAVDREILKINSPVGLAYNASIMPGKFDSN